MEIVIGIVLAIVIIPWIMKVMTSWFGRINWVNFFMVFILGGITLSIIFSFTSEGVLVILGAFSILMLIALIFGKFNIKS